MLAKTHNVKYALLYVLCTFLIVACGGGGGSSKDSNSKTNSSPSLSSISVSAFSDSLKQNETAQLTATARYSDDATENVSTQASWSSSDDSIATVSTSGLVTSISAGAATITASLEGKTGTASGTMIALSSLAVSEFSLTLKAGITQQLSATGTFSDSSNEDLSAQVTWTSSDESIATISDTGLVTALTSGSVTFTATLNDVSGGQASTPISLSGLSVSALSSTLKTGTTQQLSVTGTYSDSSNENLTTLVAWSSSNDSLATVSSTGLVTPLAVGAVTISASLVGVSDSTSSSVIALTSIAVSAFSSNLKLGLTEQLTAEGNYTDDSKTDLSDEVSWSSSNDAIASVTESGLVTSLSIGEVTITATLGSISGTSNSEMIDLSVITLSPAVLSLAKDSTQQFIATGVYTDDSSEDLSDSVVWSSNDVGVSTVNDSGLVNAIAAGTAILDATLDTVTGNANITVTPAQLQRVDISVSDEIPAGLSEQLTATGIYDDGSTQDVTLQASWSISDPSVASIEADTGLLQSLLPGSALVSASIDQIASAKLITVNSATVSSIVITPNQLDLALGTSETIDIIAILSDQSHLDISDQVSWTSGDESIADIANNESSVSTTGMGTTSITASFSGQNAILNVTVTNATLSQIDIFPINSSLPEGLTQVFSATGTYSDGSAQDISAQVTWLSDDVNIASIANNTGSEGFAQSLSNGSTNISATLENIEQSTSLTVTDATLSSIEISPPQLTLSNGSSGQFTAYGHYSNGAKIEINDSVLWSSTNGGIAYFSASESGKIETAFNGDTVISASFGELSTLGHVTVTTATLDSIAISAPLPSIPAGTQQTLTAEGSFSDGSTSDLSQQVTWASNDTSILSIDNSAQNYGLLTGSAIGSTSVSASLDGISTNTTIEITGATLSSIAISTAKANVNEMAQLPATAIATYSAGDPVDVTQQVNWSSSSPSNASIQNTSPSKGLINGLASGSTTISATLNGIASNSLLIDVLADPNSPLSINLALTPNVIINNDDDSSLIEATISPSSDSGTISNGTEVRFTITEGDSSRIETSTTTDGVASISITSSYSGLVNIEAELVDDNLSNSAGLLSTGTFTDVLLMEDQSYASFSEGILAKDSALVVYIRNSSNRIFNIDGISVFHGTNPSFTHLKDSPITDTQYTSNGALTGSEFHAFAYILEEDVSASVFHIVYFFTDAITDAQSAPGVQFIKGRSFNFGG